MDKCKEDDLLKSHSLKVTKQRLTILKEIISNEGIFTAVSLFKKLNGSIDQVTIYRVLSVFQDKNLIREILAGDESKTYELACKHNPIHPHFKCSICNDISCLKALSDNKTANLREEYSDYRIDDISIQFTGTCKNCIQ